MNAPTNLNKHRGYYGLVILYVGLFLFYLFNVSAPPGNMPIFAVMALSAVVMLAIWRDRKHTTISVCFIAIAAVFLLKEYRDGVALKSKVDQMRQHSVEK